MIKHPGISKNLSWIHKFQVLYFAGRGLAAIDRLLTESVVLYRTRISRKRTPRPKIYHFPHTCMLLHYWICLLAPHKYKHPMIISTHDNTLFSPLLVFIIIVSVAMVNGCFLATLEWLQFHPELSIVWLLFKHSDNLRVASIRRNMVHHMWQLKLFFSFM